MLWPAMAMVKGGGDGGPTLKTGQLCLCCVPWWGETMVGQLWGSGRGTMLGALLLPFLGATAGYHWWIALIT